MEHEGISKKQGAEKYLGRQWSNEAPRNSDA